jgi:hypothetical protein
VQDGDDLDPIWEDDEIDDVPESFDPSGSNVLPNDTIHCRHRLDTLKHLAEPGSELFSQSGSRMFQGIASVLNIYLSTRSENDW